MEIIKCVAFDFMIPSALVAILWGFVIGTVIFISLKLKLYGLLPVAFGVLPAFIFYLYTWFGVWENLTIAIWYSRFADISIAFVLIITLSQMYRSRYNGSKQQFDS